MTILSRVILLVSIMSTFLMFSSCGNVKPIVEEPIWSIELVKGGCLDVCKAYTIQIESNGTYAYKGIHNVPLGQKSGVINRDDLIQLTELVSDVEWLELEDSYGAQATDSQRKDLSYIEGLDGISIIYYRLEPLEIRTLEKFIDTLIEQDDF